MTPTPKHRTARRLVFALAVLQALVLAGCASLPAPPVAGVPAASQAAPDPAPAPLSRLPAVADAPSPAAAVPTPEPAPVVGTTEAEVLDDKSRQDLWQRVRVGYGVADLDSELVRKWEQWYASRPDYVQRMMSRGGRYLFHIVEEIERRKMPLDLALLPFIESAFNPQAMSSARASGMWQFMPATGKDFVLRQNLFRDDRRDVLASTRAALDYLQQLHSLFGDWQLALAAYNWGQGNVRRALDRNLRDGVPLVYEALRMPDETRNYIPKLQAVKNIVARPDHFKIALPPLENHPFFASVKIDRDIDVALAARLAGMSLEDFQQLNPQMNKPVILAAGTPQVLLPYDQAQHFKQRLAQHIGPMATWTTWLAPKTLGLAEAASMIGISEARLREVNQIPNRMLIKLGSTLLVPRQAHSLQDVSERQADHASLSLAPQAQPPRRVSFKAGSKGDSVAEVARRYKLSPDQVAKWNKVAPGASFAPGQLILVMLPPKAPAKAARTPRR